MTETTKIVIPMAGLGTRLRPHTWSRSKPLLPIAGKAVLEYILDLFQSLPDPKNVELVFIILPGHLGEQVKDFMQKCYPGVKAHYIVQEKMRGQSDAVYLARQHLHGPAFIVYADTIIETNFSFLSREPNDAVAWVKAVPDPRRFGVAVTGEGGQVERLIEKPKEMEHNLAVVGCYYFKDATRLVGAIEEQVRRGVTLKGEFFLADAINILLEGGLKMRTEPVEVWLDAGTPDAVLDTHRYLLEHGRATPSEQPGREGVEIIPPVYIHPSAKVHSSTIGPHVSLGAGCKVSGSTLRNTIVDDNTRVSDSQLEDSILGSYVEVQGQAGILYLGDNSWAVRK